MKKTGILNKDISEVVAGLGHQDILVIADAGLPIPVETWRIDLALTEGIPSFLDTLRVVLTEMQVERAIVAEEMLEASPNVYQAIRELLGDVSIETVTHHIFKEQPRSARAIIRTGEFTPYANVVLVSVGGFLAAPLKPDDSPAGGGRLSSAASRKSDLLILLKN
jgi:D-ribose pyranase